MFSSVSLVEDPHKDPDPDIPASYCIKIYERTIQTVQVSSEK